MSMLIYNTEEYSRKSIQSIQSALLKTHSKVAVKMAAGIQWPLKSYSVLKVFVKHPVFDDNREKTPQSCTRKIEFRPLETHHLDLWLVCVELMGIFLDCNVFFAGSFFEESFAVAED